MAKRQKDEDEGLPFFKFITTKWYDGNVKQCTYAAQGLFINVCVHYWNRRGDVYYSALQKTFPRLKARFKELIDQGVIKVNEDKVEISFLDRQLRKLDAKSDTYSNNANARWNRDNSNATAMQQQCNSNAIASHKEENRTEENRTEETLSEGLTAMYEITDQSQSKQPIKLTAKAVDPWGAEFSDYERWTQDVIQGNDQYFPPMLKNEGLALVNASLVEYAKSYLKLLAEYPKKAPPDQHRFRVALIGHIRENLKNSNNGQRNNAKGTSGQYVPEHGKDYKSAGGF